MLPNIWGKIDYFFSTDSILIIAFNKYLVKFLTYIYKIVGYMTQFSFYIKMLKQQQEEKHWM